jgi:hypothetical protein
MADAQPAKVASRSIFGGYGETTSCDRDSASVGRGREMVSRPATSVSKSSQMRFRCSIAPEAAVLRNGGTSASASRLPGRSVPSVGAGHGSSVRFIQTGGSAVDASQSFMRPTICSRAAIAIGWPTQASPKSLVIGASVGLRRFGFGSAVARAYSTLSPKSLAGCTGAPIVVCAAGRWLRSTNRLR